MFRHLETMASQNLSFLEMLSAPDGLITWLHSEMLCSEDGLA